MAQPQPADEVLVQRATVLAAELLDAAHRLERRGDRRRRRRLGRLVADPASRAFVQSLTDQVPRIGDPRRAAARFHDLVTRQGVPAVAGALDRLALTIGARVAPIAPRPVMALVTRRLRREAAGVILPGDDPGLARHLAHRSRAGYDQNVNPLGEAVLGEDEARRRLATVLSTIQRADVDYVSVKITAIYSQVDPLAFGATVDVLSDRLRTLYRAGRAAVPPTFVNLDMEAYDDLHLTVAAFCRVLDEEEFAALDAGIVVQAYIPDSTAVLADLCTWARERHARSGGSIKVRVVKGANLAMERVEAELRGWPQAPSTDKAEVDARYKHLLDLALDPALDGAVRVGVASHNLFDVAWALVLAEAADSTDRLDLEMLEGMAPAQAEAVRRRAGRLLLYAPVVAHDDFEAAIAYLVRRLDENAAPDNFLHDLFALDVGSPAWEAQRARFEAAVADRHGLADRPRRAQDRAVPVSPVDPDAPFVNEPDTDFSVAPNRRWVAGHVATAADQGAGDVTLADRAAVDRTVANVAKAAADWAGRPEPERRRILYRVGDLLAARRGEAIAVMAAEAGKTVTEGDVEVSEAVDFARWYGQSGALVTRLEEDGLGFTPHRVTVVASPWNFPLAIPAGGVLAALAAGSGAILKPAPQTVAVGRFLADCIEAAGVPRDLFAFLPCPEDDVGRRLITHPQVDAVILTGAWDTAQLFLSWDPKRRLHAETSGKNALVITATADLDAAVADLVRSAFGHGGQKCSAASLALVEASVYDGSRFLPRLADAVRSLRVGPAADPANRVGPLIGPPTGPLDRALRELDDGESWLVVPEPVPGTAHAWRPGVRAGVRPGSWFHLTECFGPVLGVVRVDDLAEAIAVQNAVPYGLTGGIHSLDPAEVATWLARVEVGNAYVNRPITGAIVGRQPFGGWKRSSVGPTAKAGGPNYVLTLGRWTARGPLSVERARRSFGGAWAEEFSAEHDPTGLAAEANVLRYRPLAGVLVRVDPSTGQDELAIARMAAETCGVAMSISSSVDEPDAVLAERLADAGVTKLRLLTQAADELWASAHRAGIVVDDSPVVDHGRIELLRWVREQAVSRTRHRYGNLIPDPL
ncbi:MAG: bifunctional proline dehydrogenase/L-glutamate gamma-semialdehyde dehydrogenase [Acidimicrobiales bacterium]